MIGKSVAHKIIDAKREISGRKEFIFFIVDKFYLCKWFFNNLIFSQMSNTLNWFVENQTNFQLIW